VRLAGDHDAMTLAPPSVADDIFALFAAHGSASYGEQITVSEHCLQAAYFARGAGAPASLVLAALLHDIGHLLGAAPEDLGEWRADAQHEEIGARWLAARFPAEVTEPVRLHVPAKRYLCGTLPDYVSSLSPASIVTLRLQGGPMSAEEARQFVARPHHAAAIELRRWDDRGKQRNLTVPPLESYRRLIDTLADPL